MNLRKVLFLCLALSVACTKNGPQPPEGGFNAPGNGNTDDGSVPSFDGTIRDYDGELADDAADDVPGTDKDFYWEANSFPVKVTVTYSGTSVQVSCDNGDVLYHADGAHLAVDLQTNAVSGAEIIVSGKSEDASLKIYGSSKYKLTLAGVELHSSHGPAFNSQCKKRVYVHLADGTVNRLSDASVYTDDNWYIAGSSAGSEDRKGAFFSEGHLIFSGTGALVVAGRQKHGIASDGYLYTRPGVTIAVTEAAKNAIHIKGDSGDGIGVRITGGLIYTQVTSAAGKGIKTDLHAEISGGKLDLNTSGDAVYDADAGDTSSSAGIKTDGDIVISGGRISVKSSGTGGKGLNADGSITMTGGEATVITTGGQYRYNANLTASPKGVKADGDIRIGGGKLSISVTGASDGSEGIESKALLTIDGGDIESYAYDDAINAATGIAVNGGRIWAYSVHNDGIDSNGFLHFNGGLAIASGCTTPEESFDCDDSSRFLVNGGTLIGTGSTVMDPPSSASAQRVVLYGGLSAGKEEMLAVLDAAGQPVMLYSVPRSLNGAVLFFSAPELTAGGTYTLSRGGSVSGCDDSWNGWFAGGAWSGGSAVGGFTCDQVITTVGSTGGFGGGNPGNPGGGPGGGPGGPR